MIRENQLPSKAADAFDDHAQLRHILASIRETLDLRRSTPEVVAEMIQQLRHAVLEHFDHEEDGGYFADATEIAPRLTQRANELVAQHPALAAELVALSSHAANVDESDAWWQQLTDRFDQFMQHFEAHEEAENTLIQEAYSEDIGTED